MHVYKRLFANLLILVFFMPMALVAGEAEDIKAIKAVFNKIMPGSTPDTVEPAALKGLYEVVFGAQVLYMSPDGRYVIQGDLIDLVKKENITESARSVQRAKLVKGIEDETSIIFEPKEVKHTITVFTDIDCGYCRKLHREIEQYMEQGIRVRYLAFPRSGMNTKSYHKAVTVWCSDDKQKALTEAKAGVAQETKECNNPVAKHMKLAEQFGVSGTPTIVFENGDVVPGYVPASRLSKMLSNVQSASL
jgi:thiol:disulfide interchange protein DsbC